MKNKKVLYLLAPLALILWGLIIAKIYNQLNHKSEINVVTVNNENTITQEQEDTFTIAANYSDPFLQRRLLNRSVAKIEQGVARSVQHKIPVKAVKWPNIRYGGMIINEKGNRTLYLVKIDNVNHLVGRGEQVANIELIKAFNDSIVIRMGDNVKKITKEKM